MITDRNRMQFDIREMVLLDVPSQGCERGGVGLERNIHAFGYSFLKKRTDINVAAAIEDHGRSLSVWKKYEASMKISPNSQRRCASPMNEIL
jgi:hypothetical protein